MTTPTYYNTGTASVTNGAAAVTGSGTAWLDTVQAGDFFFAPGQTTIRPVRILSVTDNTHLTLAHNWGGTTMSAAAYEISITADSIRMSERTRLLLEELSVVEANGRGLFYTFSTTTADADPGAGLLRLDNATASSATAAYLDNLDASGATVLAVLDTWDDSGATGGRGQLWLRSIADPTIFRAYNVTGSVVDGTGYRKLTLSHIGGSGSFADADEIMVTFVPIGAQGAAGTNGYLTGAGDLGTALAAFSMEANWGLAASVASNALTIALKGADGNNPSASNPVVIPFRNVTPATGAPSPLTVTAAASLVISSGSTMGFANATAGRLWIVGFNDAGTFRLGAINCLSGVDIYPLAGTGLASSTAEGGAGAADSAHVFYTGTAVTAKAYTILGYMGWAAGLTTAGTWAIVPTTIKLFTRGDKKPGDVVQERGTETGAVATGTTTIPFDDTIPQITEGDQYMAQAITPTAAANILEVEAQALLDNSNAGAHSRLVALFQDSTANALAVVAHVCENSGRVTTHQLRKRVLAASTTSTTFRIRCAGNSAGTTTFNGLVAARQFGGVLNSYLRTKEIMA